MDTFLMTITVVACAIAAIRILVLAAKIKKRAKEIAELEAADSIVFYEKIDDLRISDEIIKSVLVIFGIWSCPTALLNVWYSSYAGPFSKAIALISIVIGYIFVIRTIENRQV